MGQPDQGRGGGPLTLRLSLEASGPIAVITAWERYERLELWPRWAPQIRSVSSIAPPSAGSAGAPDARPGARPEGPARQPARLAAGLSGKVVGPLGVCVDFTVLDVDAQAHRWTWRVRRGPLALHLEHGVEPASAGRSVRRAQDLARPVASRGSLAWLVVSGPAPVVLGYAPAAWIALRRLVTTTDVEAEA